jgi:hypothetical protein
MQLTAALGTAQPWLSKEHTDMSALPNLWPWSVWYVPAAVLTILVVAALSGLARAWFADRAVRGLARKLKAAGVSADEAAFIVGSGKNRLLIANGRLTLLDADVGEVVQRLGMDEVASLRLYEDAGDSIGLRLIQKTGARTRKLQTASITAVARLFNLLTSAGKDIQYLEK